MWEPIPGPEPATSREGVEEDNTEEPFDLDSEERRDVERGLRTKTHVVPFPSELAGAPLEHEHRRVDSQYQYLHLPQSFDNPFAPFASKMDWEVARWAKMRGPGSTAVSELLKIENVSAHSTNLVAPPR